MFYVLILCFSLDSEKMAQFALEEKQIRDENIRLQKRLHMEVERQQALCRHLSESESSLEMDEERYTFFYNLNAITYNGY